VPNPCPAIIPSHLSARPSTACRKHCRLRVCDPGPVQIGRELAIAAVAVKTHRLCHGRRWLSETSSCAAMARDGGRCRATVTAYSLLPSLAISSPRARRSSVPRPERTILAGLGELYLGGVISSACSFFAVHRAFPASMRWASSARQFSTSLDTPDHQTGMTSAAWQRAHCFERQQFSVNPDRPPTRVTFPFEVEVPGA